MLAPTLRQKFGIDCCHAGAAHFRNVPTEDTSWRLTSDIAGQYLTGLREGKVVIAACRDTEYALENAKLGHGLFTAHLLTALLGEAANQSGEIAVPSLFDYLAQPMREEYNQTPLMRGNVVGAVCLGRGFDPSPPPSTQAEMFQQIERKAKELLCNYQAMVAPAYSDRDGWAAEGYKAACTTLSPILEWFKKKSDKFPSLVNRNDFRKERSSAMEYLAPLCNLDVGLMTPVGIVETKLGSGNFGTVWKVRSEVQDLSYKIYNPHDLGILDKRQRFRRGYDAMRQLDHPHIVKVHAFTECPYGFCMDFIDGSNLRHFAGGQEPVEAVRMLRTAAETLRHAHNRGVIHRDVKPENVIIEFDDSGVTKPYLVDFDLAWFSTATQVTHTQGFGTLQYSAPEQMGSPRSRRAHEPAVDVFAFGQLCFFSIKGSDPVPVGYADNQKALQGMLRQGWYSEAAREFADLYAKCTTLDPDRRPSMVAVCEDLFRIYELLNEDVMPRTRDPEWICRELAFSVGGLRTYGSEPPYQSESLAGRTNLTVSVKRVALETVDLEYKFYAVVPPTIEGVESHERLRSILLARIETELGKWPGAYKRAGSTAPFEVIVTQPSVGRSLDGLVNSRTLVGKVIDIIEGK